MTSKTGPQPIFELVPDANSLYLIALETYERHVKSSSDVPCVLAAFIFVHSLLNWWKNEGHDVSHLVGKPYYAAIRDISNGSKHLYLDRNRTEGTTKSVGGYGQGAYGAGPYGKNYISVRGRRTPNEEAESVPAARVLYEALGWWAAEMGFAPPRSPERIHAEEGLQ